MQRLAGLAGVKEWFGWRHRRRPGIRARILSFQLVMAVAVLSMLAAGTVAYRSFNYYQEREALSHQQLGAVSRLARDADQYSERIAQYLTTGTAERSEIARLQGEIAAGFDRLARFTERERRFLAAHGEEQADESEIARVLRLHQIYADMNAKIEALIAMREAGRGDIAVAVFYREIDGGLDDEFERLLAASAADELAEIDRTDAAAAKLARALGLLIGATAVLVLFVTAVAAYLLYRSIVRPIDRLSAGATAVAEGDLSFRVGMLGADELGLLAGRFDAMVAQIEGQQKLLLAARSDLEAEVSARTAELEAANESLTELDRSRVRFLADISHQLRTPLTVLRGEAEVTLRGKATASAYRETLRGIVDQAAEMGRLVEDLMVLARSETGAIRFENDPLDFGVVAAEAAREAALLGRARHILVEADIEAGARILGDRERLKQMLMILFDNAVKYSPDGATVGLCVTADGRSVAAVVRNRCEGIAEDELPRLFERFYRGGDAVRRGSTGSGLGLAIARFMVEKQGGSIALAREAAERIAVTVRFPAAPAQAALAASRETVE